MMPETARSPASARSLVSPPWTMSAYVRNLPAWRWVALWGAGGRADGSGHLALRRDPLWPGPCLSCVGHGTVDRLLATTSAWGCGQTSRTPWPLHGRGVGRSDPGGVAGLALPGGGLPQGVGAAALRWCSHVAAAGVAADARAWLVGPAASGPAAWLEGS